MHDDDDDDDDMISVGNGRKSTGEGKRRGETSGRGGCNGMGER